jgi:hypothetical protein
LGLRYISPPASFENTGQKIRFPSDIVGQRFGTCLELALLFAACCEQAGLHPLVLMHEGHAYAGCWLEERTLPEPSIDDLQQIRKLSIDALITVFETTIVAGEDPGTLSDAERLARPHLETELPFRLALDIRRARIGRIRPLPIPGQTAGAAAASSTKRSAAYDPGLGTRDFVEWVDPSPKAAAEPLTRVDQWKSRLLDLSLRNRLLNFKPTKLTIPILSASPEHVEDELAAEAELLLQPRPKLMGADDPRDADTYTRQQKADALEEHLRDELTHGRLHSGLDELEHGPRLTQLFRAARLALEENGTNTLFAAVGVLEWRETEHSDRVLRAPLLLVPVELKRKSVIEGFTLRRLDEETRLNVTLMDMLRQQFQKEIPGLDPLPEDDSGVNVARVFDVFREAVRGLSGWEVKAEIWLGQFSFTKFLLWKDLTDRLDDLARNRIVHHLINEAGHQYPNPPGDIRTEQLDYQFHPREIFCPRSADSSQLAAVLAAAAGHDFVLEGPPGTGKSQTITNIIAHCLASGKRVLFVAEKRAALDVVYRRLREEGLEPFCLELHSNKAGKAEVVAQFAKSLNFIAQPDAHNWERREAELEKLRSALNGYTHALHFRHPCGLSAYHCLDYLLPRQNEPTVRLDDWPTLRQTTTATLDRAREFARRLQERSNQLQPLADHPLAPLNCEDWSPAWAERALDHVRELAVLTQNAKEAALDLRNWLGCSTTSASHAELIHLYSLAKTLLMPQPVGPAFATTPWNQLVTGLNEWIALTQERADLRAELAPLFKERPRQPGTTAGHPLHQLGCEEWSSVVAERIFGSSRELCEIINAAGKAAHDLHTLLRFPRTTVSRTELVHLVELVDCLLGPLPVGAAFATAPWNKIVAALDGWVILFRERADLRTKLKGYNEAKLLVLDLDALQQRWESAQAAWFLAKWLRIGGVRRQLRTARPDNARPDVASLAAVLKAALRLRTINASLASSTPDAEAYLGLIWAGAEPDGESLAIVRSWGEALHASMATCAGNDLEWLGQLRQLLAGLFNDGPAAYAPGTPVGDRLSRYRDTITGFDNAFAALSTEICLKRGPLDDASDHLSAVTGVLSSFLQNAMRLRAINSNLTSAAPTAQACLGVIWNNGEPSVETLVETQAWGNALHSSLVVCVGGNLPWLSEARHVLAGIFAEGPTAYAPGTIIGDRLGRYRDAFTRFDEAFDWFVREMHIQPSAWDAATDHFATVRALTERLPIAWPKLRFWCSWQKARQEGLRLGLAPIITQLESPDGATLDTPALFERSFRRALLFAIVDVVPMLREFFGHEHSERIERFRHLDKMMATLTRDLIRARLAARIPRDQIQHDIPKAELGLLRKEIGKKMRHIPVRQLLSRIPRLLPRLKPCVLMSPLSVAQYLEPSHAAFDVVIFDEGIADSSLGRRWGHSSRHTVDRSG